MLRLLPLLAFALLPAAVAAPVPPGGRVEFGARSLLTAADLEKVHFDSRPVKDAEKFEKLKQEEEVKEAKVRPKNRYDVAVHMPWTTFRAGEPVPAYFVLRNNRAAPLGLGSRMDLSGPTAALHGDGCSFDIRDRATGKPVVVLLSASTNCGGDYLVDVPADGFYCVKGDLNRLAGQALPPGEYEVDWHYGALTSAPVTFAVLKPDGAKPAALPKRPALRVYHIEPAFQHDEQPEEAGEPVRWRDCHLNHVGTDDLAAALAVGRHGVCVPDLHAVPAADKLVEARAEWRPYHDGDRVVVTLRVVPPYKSVRFAEVPQLHLQVESADDERMKWALAEEAKQGDRKHSDANLVTPLTVEVRLPADWRARSGVTGGARVAVLVTANRVELPHGERGLEKVLQKADKVSRAPAGDRPPVWSGIVRTDFTELRFPLPLVIANPAP